MILINIPVMQRHINTYNVMGCVEKCVTLKGHDVDLEKKFKFTILRGGITQLGNIYFVYN